ncbi:MAG TPA: cupin domain-containing protein [Thermomicrobiales bacterium]|nr:cupin domain-containing protein [Thermomicrobiales bacterium]
MAGVTTIDFDHPDDTRTFSHGRVDIVRVGPSTIARLSLEPGWHWSEHVKPVAGTETCQARHVGFMESGRLHVMMEDGTQMDIGPGETYVIEPGHDAEVIGNNPIVALEFATETAEGFARVP